MNDDKLDEIERQIHDAIRFHREQYEKAVKPLVDRLVQIHGFRRPVLIMEPDAIDSFAPYVPGPQPGPE